MPLRCMSESCDSCEGSCEHCLGSGVGTWETHEILYCGWYYKLLVIGLAPQGVVSWAHGRSNTCP